MSQGPIFGRKSKLRDRRRRNVVTLATWVPVERRSKPEVYVYLPSPGSIALTFLGRVIRPGQ